MSTASKLSTAAAIRQEFGFPVVDCDGHVLEVTPVLVEYIRETAGDRYADAFAASTAYDRYSSPWKTSAEERKQRWIPQPNLWGWPTKNTLGPGDSHHPRAVRRSHGRARHRLQHPVPERRTVCPRASTPTSAERSSGPTTAGSWSCAGLMPTA